MKLITLLIYMNILNNPEVITDFKPERVQRSATINIQGKIENVFPLFGPIREMEWAEGWSPEVIYRSNDKVLVEEHMIFQTKGHADEGKYTWIVTQFQLDKFLVEYTVSTHERIWFIKVACKHANENTVATVTYSYTGLSNEGNRKNEQALKRMFAHDLKDWEEAINYYLKTGKLFTTN